jgi:hypothetical protein
MIYFIRRPDGGPIKIGTTIRLTERLKQLIAEHGPGLEVLAVAEGSYDRERELHRRFSHLRHGRTEQFEPGDDLVGFIVAEGRAWDGSDESPLRHTAIQMKGTEEWKGWLDRLSKFLRTPTATIVDHSLIRYAKEMGFTEEAPER